MRVFVAGATGAIGKQLVPRLLAAGHEVHGMTRSESKQGLLYELGAVPVVADALDPDQVAEAVARAIGRPGSERRARCSPLSTARVAMKRGIRRRAFSQSPSGASDAPSTITAVGFGKPRMVHETSGIWPGLGTNQTIGRCGSRASFGRAPAPAPVSSVVFPMALSVRRTGANRKPGRVANPSYQRPVNPRGAGAAAGFGRVL